MKYRVAIFAEASDNRILEQWSEEGFDPIHYNVSATYKDLKNQLLEISDPLEPGEKYAVVAYGAHALACLEAAMSPIPKLCGMIALYPPSVPPIADDCENLSILQLHLAGSQLFSPSFKKYYYPKTEPGFAEPHSEHYNGDASRLLWSRSLGFMRNAFSIKVDIEQTWDDHLTRAGLSAKNAMLTIATFVSDAPQAHEPHVNYVPTGAGGYGTKELERFYDEVFYATSPASLRARLLSRTVGADRIADELIISFEHTQEVAWVLPGVPPTNRHVEFPLAVIVGIRAGKLAYEHMYYDQASVLKQVGLLPDVVGGIRLPVLGVEAAKKVADGGSDGLRSNSLVTGWKPL